MAYIIRVSKQSAEGLKRLKEETGIALNRLANQAVEAFLKAQKNKVK